MLALLAGRLPRRAAGRERVPLSREILIPFLILSLAAIGLNILIGYCGQVSLGTGGFMAIGAYAAYNLASACRVPQSLRLLLLGGLRCRRRSASLFGVPSPAHQGLLSRRAPRWPRSSSSTGLFLRVKWLTNYTPSGSVTRRRLEVFGCDHRLADRELPGVAGLRRRAGRWSPRTWCAAISAARGWRSATWTSPPRSSASGRCTPSSPPSPCRRS